MTTKVGFGEQSCLEAYINSTNCAIVLTACSTDKKKVIIYNPFQHPTKKLKSKYRRMLLKNNTVINSQMSPSYHKRTTHLCCNKRSIIYLNVHKTWEFCIIKIIASLLHECNSNILNYRVGDYFVKPDVRVLPFSAYGKDISLRTDGLGRQEAAGDTRHSHLRVALTPFISLHVKSLLK